MIFLIIQCLCVFVLNVDSNPVLYDQRQTGETNVNIEMKDVVFIAMSDGELGGDYDYSYDYSDLTVKPESPQSTKPTFSSTTEVNPSEASTPQNGTLYLENSNNTLIISSNKPQSQNGTEPNKLSLVHPQQPLNTENFQIPVVVVHEKKPEKHYVSSTEIRRKAGNSNSSSVRTEELPLRNCSPGFFLDSRNRCKKIKRPHLSQRERPQLPFGLRFAQRPDILSP